MYRFFNLDGKVALVTGASSGLGRHFAKTLAAAGVQIAAAARRVERLENLVEEIRSTGGDALAISLDVTDRQAVTEAFDAAEARYGGVDILINNAGIAEPSRFLDIDEQSWQRVIDVNLSSTWRVAQEAAKRMVSRQHPGSIINIASIAGLSPSHGLTSYGVSKAGVIQMTRQMAGELIRYGIRVNAIAPGYIRTEMNDAFFATEQGQEYVQKLPMRRLGELHELDGLVLLLASDASSFMTGTVIPIDGGQLVQPR